MQLDGLLNKLTVYRLDDTAVPPLWSDQEKCDNLNDAVRQLCMRQRCLIESVNSDLCTFNVTAGQLMVPLDPHVLAVRFVYQVDSDHNIGRHDRPTGITTRQLMRDYPQWLQEIEHTGPLRHWVPDYQEGMLALFPFPAEDCTLQASVWRLPLEEEELTLSDPSMSPVIPLAWHEDLLDWAEHRCYSKRDADTFDPKAAATAELRFTSKVGRLPTATEIRLWGVQPNMRTRTEYA